ncbi:MAG: hypothetical protein OEY97_13470, partial [Nitrospirota bacterium]|nr:hypothetical protein [Nitrospirota bacterium]
MNAQVDVKYLYKPVLKSAGKAKAGSGTGGGSHFGNPGTGTTLGLTNVGNQGYIAIGRQKVIPVYMSDGTGAGLPEGWSISGHHRLNWNALQLSNGSYKLNQQPTISTVAGTVNVGGFAGDGGPALGANLNGPFGIVSGPDGSLFINDRSNYRIRKIGPDGIITTVAGNGINATAGDGGLAVNASLEDVRDLALGPDGTLYIAERYRIRKVEALTGIITTVAGGGTTWIGADGTPALDALIRGINSVAVAPDGSVYFYWSDGFYSITRRISPDGKLYFVPLGRRGASDMVFDAEGNMLFISGPQIFKMAPDGVVTLLAGNGTGGMADYEGPATSTGIGTPRQLAIGPMGEVYFTAGETDPYGSDYSFVRVLSTDGLVRSFVRPPRSITPETWGQYGQYGDGGPAIDGALAISYGITVSPDGSVYIADGQHQTIRRVAAKPAPMVDLNAGEQFVPNRSAGVGYVFDTLGRHLRTVGLESRQPTREFSYDPVSGNLIGITDPRFGTTTTIQWSGGVPVSLTSPDGHVTTLSMSGNRLSGITYPDNTTFNLEFSPDGLLTRKVRPNGADTRYVYGPDGRVVESRNPYNVPFRFAVTMDQSADTTITVPGGRSFTKRRTPTESGSQTVEWTSPSGLVTTSTRSADGLRRTAVSPSGTSSETVLAPDPGYPDQLIKLRNTITLPSGTSVSTKRTTVYGADANGDGQPDTRTRTITSNGRTTTIVKDTVAGIVTTTTPSGRSVATHYDTVTLNNTLRDLPGTLHDVRYGYDARGRLISTARGTAGVDERVSTTTWGTDPADPANTNGRVARVTGPDGRYVTFEYDAVGRVLKTHRYDASGVLIDTVAATYDSMGNRTSLITPSGTVHTFAYNLEGLETDYTPPAVDATNPATTYTYNDAKQLTSVARPDGQALRYRYEGDQAGETNTGRLLEITLDDGDPLTVNDPVYGFVYAATTTGQLTTLIAPDGGTLDYTYDGSVALSETTAGVVNGTVSRTLDADMRTATQSVNGAYAIAYSYDVDGLPSQIGQEVISRDAVTAQLTGTTVGGVSTSNTYNNFGEFTGHSAAMGGAPIIANGYTRDNLGRIASRTETVNGVTATYAYAYDAAGRLVTVSKDGVTVESYDWGPNGNRALGYSAEGGADILPAGPYTYDAQDRLVSTGAATYAYTANGELLSKTEGANVTAYDYDILGNLRG